MIERWIDGISFPTTSVPAMITKKSDTPTLVENGRLSCGGRISVNTMPMPIAKRKIAQMSRPDARRLQSPRSHGSASVQAGRRLGIPGFLPMGLGPLLRLHTTLLAESAYSGLACDDLCS